MIPHQVPNAIFDPLCEYRLPSCRLAGSHSAALRRFILRSRAFGSDRNVSFRYRYKISEFCVLNLGRLSPAPPKSRCSWYRIETFPSYNGSRETDDLCSGGRPGYFSPRAPSSGSGKLQRATLLDRQSCGGRCRTAASRAVFARHPGAGKSWAGALTPDTTVGVARIG